jgi:RNA-binding protein 5/10
VQSQILVIYPLHQSVTEEDFAALVKKLELDEKPVPTPKNPNDPPKLKSTAPTGDTTGYGAKPGSIYRIFLMRDRGSNESLKYGFVEFWTMEEATAAVTKFQVARNFTILGQPVMVSGIHTGVFVPDTREPVSESEKYSFAPLFNPALRVKYWDPTIYPSQLVVNAEPPAAIKGPNSDSEKADDVKKSKKRKADGTLAASSTKKSMPMMVGQMAKWQQKHAELYGGEAGGNDLNAHSDADAGIDRGGQGQRAPFRISMPSSSTATPIAAAGQRAPVKISLGGLSKMGTAQPVQPAALVSTTSTTADSPTGPVETSTPTPATSGKAIVSYVDRDKTCCLICMMKYKSIGDLEIHEKSRNHHNAMSDADKVKAALPRLAARDKRMREKAASDQPQNGVDESTTQYRDRAKERREAFNQPEKPKTLPPGSKVPRVDKLPRPPIEPEAPPAPPKSKGSTMLAKMGWSAGQGLGANGDGRTEAIATHAYEEGVGLGVEGGNLGDAAQLAERRTKGSYAEYVNSAQDKARERYNRMG